MSLKFEVAEGVDQADGAPRIRDCPWCWGSHACSLLWLHGGNHRCVDDDGEACHEVDQDGNDASGFTWDLWGGEGWDDIHPSWSRVEDPCPACGFAWTLASDCAGRRLRTCHRCNWLGSSGGSGSVSS